MLDHQIDVYQDYFDGQFDNDDDELKWDIADMKYAEMREEHARRLTPARIAKALREMELTEREEQ